MKKNFLKHGNPFKPFYKPKGITPHSSLLHEAIKYASLACFKFILKEVPDDLLNATDNLGRTCLHVAADNVAPEFLGLLLKRKININARNDEGNTALHILDEKYDKAIRRLKNKIRQCVDMLLKIPGIDTHAINSSKKTIRLLSEDKYFNQILLNRENAHLNEITNDNWLVKVSNSILCQNDKLSLKLLNDMKSKNLDIDYNKAYIGSLIFLCYAVKNLGSIEIVKLLLDCGAAAKLRTMQDDKLPLHLAIEKGCLETTSLLLSRMVNGKGKIDLRKDSFSILQAVLKSVELAPVSTTECVNPIACLERLLAEDVLIDVNATDDSLTEGKDHPKITALHIAASINSQEAMKLLIIKGAYLLQPHEADVYDGSYVLSILECETLCEAMNGCIKAPMQQDSTMKLHILELDYRFLLPSKSIAENSLKTRSLFKITKKPDYKKFIMHPLMKTLLEVKWATVRKYIWLNFGLNLIYHIVFLAFIIILNIDIFSLHMNNDTASSDAYNDSTILQYAYNDTSQLYYNNSIWLHILFEMCSLLMILMLPYFIFINIYVPLRSSIKRAIKDLDFWAKLALYVMILTFTCLPRVKLVKTWRHLAIYGLILGW